MKNMRKLVAVILAAICLCACVASAEAVQSPTKPTAVVTLVTPVTAVEGVAPFTVATVEVELWSETAVQLFDEITLALADPTVAPVSLFTEEEMAAVVPFLPVDFDAATLAIAEYIPLTISDYVSEIGDVAVQFALPGEYTEEDVIVAMFKPFNGDESTWVALEAALVVSETEPSAAEGISNISVLFTQDVLEKLNANEGALVILRS